MAKISFIIVAYNEERTIARCLDAILAQENLADYEIIAVDDGSTDKTAQTVMAYCAKNPSIRLHRLPCNQGRGSARAAGIYEARGEYIAFVDADIVLPPFWLKTCLEKLDGYDAVGGIAVPDGDVNYIYTLLGLKPKIVNPTTTVSGSNGLYRREIFSDMNFDANLREGEDSAFNKAMAAKGFRMLLIRDLTVEHREARKFGEAMEWLYETGKGATRQLKQFREMRLPDLAYFGIMGSLIVAMITWLVYGYASVLALPVLGILAIDVIYMHRKFYFEISNFHKYLASILVFALLLAAYFAGRTAGWFMPVPQKRNDKKKIMVCFDLEGKWGMPAPHEYDIEKSVDRILEILDKHKVKAVFFTVGRLIEENPQLIKRISDKGHAIALHGYEHEHINKLDKQGMQVLAANITKMKSEAEELTGKKITGFRSPFLMAPIFSSKELYDALSKEGFDWISNREIRYVEELFRPDRIGFFGWPRRGNIIYDILLVLLNLRLVFTDDIAQKGYGRITANIRWLTAGTVPLQRYGLLEFPVYSPLDCDLVELSEPNKKTPEDFIKYAIDVLTEGAERDGGFYSLTFHDWIIGTANRSEILDKTLEILSSKKGIDFISSPEKT